MTFKSILAAAFLSVAFPAFATPQSTDATDLWIDPAESGWGISVFHQGDTLFASLFVYGPDGQPKWYTASNLAPGPTTYTGALAEATGPYFGAQAPFNPDAVSRRVVGQMTITVRDNDGTVDYTVDGTRVTKPISRFSMRHIPIGARYASLVQPASGSQGEILVLDQHLSGFNDTATTLDMSSDSNRTSSCSFKGTSRTQNGETVTASGVEACGTDPQPPQVPWSMKLDPTPHGFTGTFSGNFGNAKGLSQARFAAANWATPSLQGTGYINDLWFPPNEGGWGLNLIEQGDMAFATLFVYDAQNRPHWYSASQLAAGTQGGRPSWSGSLEESTGPYFGASFDPSQVARRVVGSMTFTLQENGDGSLAYNVNGVSVVKTVNRFAFRKNDLSGSYQGMVVMRADDPRGLSYDDAAFTIDDQGDVVNIHIGIFTGPTCDFAGHSIQYGSQRSVYGTYTCQGGATGRFELNDLMVTANGLTGTYSGPAGHIGGTITYGTLSGARR